MGAVIFFMFRLGNRKGLRMKIVTRVKALFPRVLLGIFVVLGLLTLLSAYPTKEEWLRGRASSLSDLKITQEMIAKARPWKRGGTFYILQGSEGVIPFGSGGAVYVVTHSFHDNYWRLLQSPALLLLGRRPVSDATLAVDQQGRLYTCEGHICGALTPYSRKEVKTLQDFLETYSYADPKNVWKPYQPE
jgi:hypothetical protein